LMKQPVFLFNHPDYIRELLVTRQSNFIKGRIWQRSKRLLGEGLLTSEGETHLRQRRLVQPAFYRERLQSYAAIMAGYAARARDRWQAGAELDMQSEMMRLTLAIVAKALFGTEVEGDAQAVGHAMSDVIDLFRFMTLPYSEHLDDWPLPHKRRFERAKAILEGAVYRMIHQRRASGDNNTKDYQGDLLSTLLAIRDEDGSGLADQQLRDEILTLFIAGHETTAIWQQAYSSLFSWARSHGKEYQIRSTRADKKGDFTIFVPNGTYTVLAHGRAGPYEAWWHQSGVVTVNDSIMTIHLREPQVACQQTSQLPQQQQQNSGAQQRVFSDDPRVLIRNGVKAEMTIQAQQIFQNQLNRAPNMVVREGRILIYPSPFY
jgi:hypothetical protein